jgi:hypothetical protein
MADDVQSPAGDQGAGTTDSGYAQYLDSVAPEIREQVEPLFKEFDGNVTKKFQEHAEYRKGWAPFEELGVNELDPQQLKGLLDFANLAKNPEQFSQWWKAAGEEMGLFEKFTAETEGDGLSGLEDLSKEEIAELIDQKVAEKLGPVEQTVQQEKEDRMAAQANDEVAKAMEAIRSGNSQLFEGEDEDHQGKVEQRIARLAYAYSEDPKLSPAEMIQKGFEDYQEMIGQSKAEGEAGLFAEKANQPKPPEGPGGADMSPEKITSFDQHFQDAAVAKLKNAQQ